MAEYIEREQLIRALKDVIADYKDAHAFSTDFAATIVTDILDNIVRCQPATDVAPVRHGRCDVCSGKAVLTQDAYNGYSIEIDAEQQEAAVWYGDECLAVFHIDFCPNCGAKMDGVDGNSDMA